jgi:hypothetical protein
MDPKPPTKSSPGRPTSGNLSPEQALADGGGAWFVRSLGAGELLVVGGTPDQRISQIAAAQSSNRPIGNVYRYARFLVFAL